MIFPLVIASVIYAAPSAVPENAAKPPPAISTYKMCSSTKSIYQLDTLVLTPNPMVKGIPQGVSVSGVLTKSVIDGAKASLTMKIAGKKIFGTTFDLCKLAEKKGLACPIPAGPFAISVDSTIPGFIPGGKYELDFIFSNGDANTEEIACANVFTNL